MFWRNRELFLAKWGELIRDHTPGSGTITPPASGDLPRQERESDPERQERAQLERALATTRAYAESLRARLQRREALLARLRRVDARLDSITRGRWKTLRDRSHLSAPFRR